MTVCGNKILISTEKLWQLPQLDLAQALVQWQNSRSVNVNLHQGVTILTTTSTFKFLHRTSISNFRLSFRSGSWCSSARTFIIDIVHGFGGLNTCKRLREKSDRYTSNSSGRVTFFHLCLQPWCNQSSLWQIFGYKLKYMQCLILSSNFMHNGMCHLVKLSNLNLPQHIS